MSLKKTLRMTTTALACLCLAFAVGCSDPDGNNGGGNNGNNGGNNTSDTGMPDDTNSPDDTGGEDDTTEDDTSEPTDTGGDEDTTSGCTAASPSGACDPLCQTDCQSGETCLAGTDADGNFQSQCIPTGSQTVGQECGQEAGACATGLGCLGSADGSGSVCLQYCRTGSDEAPQCENPDAVCRPIVENGNIGVCQVPEDNCQTFPPEDTCGEGQNCYPLQGGGQDCFDYNDSASAGDSCASPPDCNDLQVCVGTQGGDNQCAEKCDTSLDAADNRCADGETCQGLQNADFGVCAPSQ